MKGLLLVVDGMGFSSRIMGNAIVPTNMPFLFGLAEERGVAMLEASGEAVGLAAGQAGNSEIGHLTIGAGRRVPSTLENIRKAAADGTWASHVCWREIAKHDRVHVVGLLSDAGVHGHHWSLTKVAELAAAHGVRDVVVHPILDGVDSAAGTAPRLLSDLALSRGARLGCIVGRKGACDRSGDLSPTEAFVSALQGDRATPIFSCEKLEAHLAYGSEGSFACHLSPGGSHPAPGEPVILTNHRADRTTQLARVLSRGHPVTALVELGDAVPLARVFFPTRPLDRGLATELAAQRVTSVRIAESCKFPHVTFFLDGFRPTDARCISIPSIPEAEIGDRPEMRLREVVDAIVAVVAEPRDAAIVANIANLDQVGHVGRLDRAVEAARLVDDALRAIHAACRRSATALVITSDHGNADAMLDDAGRPLGSHSTNPVPLIVDASAPGKLHATRGSLTNVTATFLEAMGLRAAPWMEPSLWTRTE